MTIGAVVSGTGVTVIVRVTMLEIFPDESIFLYSTVYVPTTAVFTEPDWENAHVADHWDDPV